MEKYKLIDNKEHKQYEYRLDQYVPHISYKKKGKTIALLHTNIPSELRGKGVGSMLVKDVLEDISNQNLQLIPLCSFVARYIKNNPEYKSLLPKDIYIG